MLTNSLEILVASRLSSTVGKSQTDRLPFFLSRPLCSSLLSFIIFSHRLRVKPSRVEEARPWECEVASHVVCVVRKQRPNTVPRFSFLFSSGPQAREQCSPHQEWVFLPQLTQSKNSQPEACDSNPVKQTVTVSYHKFTLSTRPRS